MEGQVCVLEGGKRLRRGWNIIGALEIMKIWISFYRQWGAMESFGVEEDVQNYIFIFFYIYF